MGIPLGLLLAALHHAGLASLTHTLNPIRFLHEILGRPVNERPVLLMVTEYPDLAPRVPVITKKSLAEIVTFRYCLAQNCPMPQSRAAESLSAGRGSPSARTARGR